MNEYSKGRVLVADDDSSMLRTMKLLLRDEFDLVTTLSNPNRIPEEIRKDQYDVVLLDMNFSAGVQTGNEGLFWMKEIFGIDPSIVVIMITAYGYINLAINAIKQGATDFIVKPWENEKLIATLKTGVKLRQSSRKIFQLENQQHLLQEDIRRMHHLIAGSSPAMQAVMKIINKVASTDANVLILGENGTGKEVIAREIHLRSERREKPFITVDLGSLSETLFESELFGHIKGAFTGADSDRIGRIESSSGGTLFLDEIGNIPLSLQGKLLSSIQQKKIVPLGSSLERHIDMRLICATNRPLKKMVEENLFREDLLYRINTVQIDVPPLRDRGDDIISLSEHFLMKYARKYRKPDLRLTRSVLQKFKTYKWPGNVRELEHTIEKAVILCDRNTLSNEDFVFAYGYEKKEEELKTFDDIEKYYINRALQKHAGKLTEVAKELNISRQTIYRKIKKYGL
jgi:DNA-binding NtrC family response regulator